MSKSSITCSHYRDCSIMEPNTPKKVMIWHVRSQLTNMPVIGTIIIKYIYMYILSTYKDQNSYQSDVKYWATKLTKPILFIEIPIKIESYHLPSKCSMYYAR